MIVLKKRSEFLALRRGKKQVSAGFILQVLPRSGQETEGGCELPPRFGFTVSKKVGNAVQRNRVKRRLRALIRDVAPELAHPQMDYGIIGRKAALQRPYAAMRKDMIRAFKKLHSPSGQKKTSRRNNS